MQVVLDLHIHSKYSRACSRDLTLEQIDKFCQIKGVKVIATADFTHPEWFKELKTKLVEKEEGLYQLKGSQTGTRFLCSTEISSIYSKGGKVRRIHTVILAPNLSIVEKINKALGKIGNLKADGRPILGLDVEELAKICLDIDQRCMIIPAHIWTPWFAMFGSKSGFDSIEEAFGSMSKYIYAIETGLSSDPPMNWRVKNLDRVSIVSNSDAHSLPNIAREANVLEIKPADLSYQTVTRILRESKSDEFLYTIEFYPEEGMYHYDGHRSCGVSLTPAETKKYKGICPVCKKPLTVGVLNRVEELADSQRGDNYVDKKRVPYKKLIELDKIIAESLSVKSRRAKRVQEEYMRLIKKFGNELNILLKVMDDELQSATWPQIAEAIKRVRAGRVIIKPGFDGQYGTIKIFDEQDRLNYQRSLF